MLCPKHAQRVRLRAQPPAPAPREVLHVVEVFAQGGAERRGGEAEAARVEELLAVEAHRDLGGHVGAVGASLACLEEGPGEARGERGRHRCQVAPSRVGASGSILDALLGREAHRRAGHGSEQARAAHPHLFPAAHRPQRVPPWAAAALCRRRRKSGVDHRVGQRGAAGLGQPDGEALGGVGGLDKLLPVERKGHRGLPGPCLGGHGGQSFAHQQLGRGRARFGPVGARHVHGGVGPHRHVIVAHQVDVAAAAAVAAWARRPAAEEEVGARPSAVQD
mmetsp:Transcript_38856/g.86840  ORF Transcript_38856/g.86840 Transcript_38856/m.86840 type:complete len:277 (+) Transcript_38856:2289-3119(+)